MNYSIICLLAAWGCLAPFLLLQLFKGCRLVIPRPRLGPLKSILLHAHVFPRRCSGTHTIVVLHGLAIGGYVALNVFALLFRARDDRVISQRSADLCMTNITLLTLGAVPWPLTETLLGISRRVLSSTHYWIGRVATLHLIVHAIVEMSLRDWRLPSALEWTVGADVAQVSKHLDTDYVVIELRSRYRCGGIAFLVLKISILRSCFSCA